MQIKNNKLYISNINVEKLAQKYGTPLYVYEKEKIQQRYNDWINNIKYNKLKIHYAIKANENADVLKFLLKIGSNVETVSKGEVKHALKIGYKPSQIIHTCANIEKEELKFIIKNNITINVDSLRQLEWFGQIKPNGKVGLRINRGFGAGAHKHLKTSGPNSHFGVYFNQVNKAKEISEKYNLNIIGIHQHIGSGSLKTNDLIKAIKFILQTAKEFKNLEYADFGGGFGIPYKPKDKGINMKKVGKEIVNIFKNFNKKYGKELTFIFEPGKYIVGEAGYLLFKVVDIKHTPAKKFIGVNSGFNHLIRPMMYDAYHQVINASNVDGKEKEVVSIAGNICENGDVFAHDRKLSSCSEGDIIAILNAGAYGFAMSSNYNLRDKPKEILI